MKDHILWEILTEVNENGDYSIPLDSLKPTFNCDDKHNPCVKERLLIWAVENHVFYEYKEVNHATLVRFIRREY